MAETWPKESEQEEQHMKEPKGTVSALLIFVAINTVLVALGVWKLVELFL